MRAWNKLFDIVQSTVIDFCGFKVILKKYIQNILERYPETNISRFRDIFELSKEKESSRASAADSAFDAVQNMIREEKLLFF